MKIKLKDSAPWPKITLPNDFTIYKDKWVKFKKDSPGFKGIETLVEYQEEEKKVRVKKEIIKDSIVIESDIPELPE